MRLFPALAVAGLLTASLAAHADTLALYAVSGYTFSTFPGSGNRVGGDPDWASETFGSSLTGTATYDVDRDLFTQFEMIGDPEIEYGGDVIVHYTASGFSGSYNSGPYASCYEFEGSDCFQISGDGLDGFKVIATDNSQTGTFYNGGGFNYNVTYDGTLTLAGITSAAETPEPSSIALLGTGLLGVAGVARRRWTA